MKLLVTGGAGFIGSHLCAALVERGDEVWCADNLYLGRIENIAHLQGNEKFHFIKLDLLEPKALEDLFSRVSFAAVFHLAANSDIQQGGKDHQVDLRLTFLTTHEVLEAMLRHGVKKILFASSSAVFGESDAELHENYGPLQPISFYGASKLAAEAFISVYANNYGFEGRIIRFPNVVGARATHGAIHDFIERLRRDPTRLQVLGDGSQSKPYLYVGDLIGAILLVFDKARGPLDVYHVGNNGETSVRQMAQIVLEELGLNVPIVYTGGKVGWVGDVHHFKYDMSKIKSLGFRQRYDSTQAVRQAVRKILENNHAEV